MRIIRTAWLAGLLFLVLPASTRAQDGPYCQPKGTYDQIKKANPDAVEMTVQLDSVQVYQKPTERSIAVARLPRGKRVLVYRHWGPWVQIATPEKGHFGFIKESDVTSGTAAQPPPEER